MFAIFTKRFWQLRKKRKQIFAAMRNIPDKHFWITKNYNDLHCGLCHEPTYEVSLSITTTSFAGEEFYSPSNPIAYFCTRCEAIGGCATVGGSKSNMLIWDWIKNPVDFSKSFEPKPI